MGFTWNVTGLQKRDSLFLIRGQGELVKKASQRRQYLHSRGWPTFSLEGQIINILSFLGHTLFVTITRLCSCSLKAARDTEQMNGCYYVTRKLYLLQWVVGQTGPMGQCADPCFEGWVSFNLLEEERKIITVSGKGSRNVLSNTNKTLLENC